MPIRDPKPSIDELPECVREAFRDRALLSLPKTARLLGMHPDTLYAMKDRGQLSYRIKGVGVRRPQTFFAIDDVAALWHTMRSPVVGLTGARHGEKYPALRQAYPAQKR